MVVQFALARIDWATRPCSRFDSPILGRRSCMYETTLDCGDYSEGSTPKHEAFPRPAEHPPTYSRSCPLRGAYYQASAPYRRLSCADMATALRRLSALGTSR
jgi:hypothetical protein